MVEKVEEVSQKRMKKVLHGEKVWKESQTRSQLRIKSNLFYKGVCLLNDFLK